MVRVLIALYIKFSKEKIIKAGQNKDLLYNLFSHGCALWCMVFYLKHIKKNLPASTLVLALILTFAFVSIIATAKAETGKGDDVFRVIMTIFGVDKSKGDVVAILTVNNGEASKVRFLNSDTAASGGIIEYVATFPNVTVNDAQPYEACVLPVKTLEPICTSGNNSPAARPEFVDLSLNATTGPENGLPEDVGVEEGEE